MTQVKKTATDGDMKLVSYYRKQCRTQPVGTNETYGFVFVNGLVIHAFRLLNGKPFTEAPGYRGYTEKKINEEFKRYMKRIKTK